MNHREANMYTIVVALLKNRPLSIDVFSRRFPFTPSCHSCHEANVLRNFGRYELFVTEKKQHSVNIQTADDAIYSFFFFQSSHSSSHTALFSKIAFTTVSFVAAFIYDRYNKHLIAKREVRHDIQMGFHFPTKGTETPNSFVRIHVDSSFYAPFVFSLSI